ncbi:asialoglycoprotein receptor 1 [Genypterus blacodes]|uniref:asialoglycoprotein receptor 1 n=1 Tax=Genypterus blacodes TaxID=154954 RepID=UPI003F758C31
MTSLYVHTHTPKHAHTDVSEIHTALPSFNEDRRTISRRRKCEGDRNREKETYKGIAMTTEYHDENEDDSSTFWTKESPPIYLYSLSRYRSWLVPALTAAVILSLIIALGASNTKASNRLWSLEQKTSNLSDIVQSLSASLLLAKDTAKEVRRLQFAVETNVDKLTSVSEALKQLTELRSLSRVVSSLKCSLERFINNVSSVEGCCPVDWDLSGSSCYYFSSTVLTWYKARDWCEEHESHLVILMTDEEWDFVTKQALGALYWTGLTDERTGKWEWVNQTPYIMNNRRWKPGQPDSWTGHGYGHGDEDCAHLHSDGHLNDLHCSTVMRYICQSHSQHS